MINKVSFFVIIFLLISSVCIASTGTYVVSDDAKVEYYELINDQSQEAIIVIYNESYTNTNKWIPDDMSNIIDYISQSGKSVFALNIVDNVNSNELINDINNSIEIIKQRYNLSKIRLIGYGNGATTSLHLAILNPKLYDTVILINGLYMNFKTCPITTNVKYHIFYTNIFDNMYEISANYIYECLKACKPELYELKCDYKDIFNEILIDEYMNVQ